MSAVYTKHRLFPSEARKFTPGPYSPSTFAIGDGRVFGMVICFEGVWPLTQSPPDWSQMEDLVAMVRAFAAGAHTMRPHDET